VANAKAKTARYQTNLVLLQSHNSRDCQRDSERPREDHPRPQDPEHRAQDAGLRTQDSGLKQKANATSPICAIALHMVRRCASDSHAPSPPRGSSSAASPAERGAPPKPLQNDMQMQLTEGRKNLGCN